jgi:hypothetical protein
MERAPGTRGKYLTHRRTILTWVVWKGALPRLLPMSDELLRAFLLDALAFEASLSVLRQAINAVLAWQDRLRLEPPLSGKRAYKRLIHSLFPLPRRTAPDLLSHLRRLVRGCVAGAPFARATSLHGATVWPAPPQRSHALVVPRRLVCRSATYGGSSTSWQAIYASREGRL